MEEQKPYVNITIADHVAEIEFFHPRHNALPLDMLDQLEAEILKAGKNERVNVILLKSGGDRTFCAGADFEQLKSISDKKEGLAFFSGFAKLILAIKNCQKPVIVRLQGKAVGGGVGIAAAGDMCFATAQASVRLSELNIGIGPFVIAPAVERKIGKTNFSRMSLQPDRWMSAEEAKNAGLFSEVFPNTEEMDQYINEYLQKMASYNPQALLEMKKILWEGTENWDSLLIERAAMSGKLVLSPFTKQALNKS
jgi:methylglutaconyl-CoA hydratase